jgi:hypothetical protein
VIVQIALLLLSVLIIPIVFLVHLGRAAQTFRIDWLLAFGAYAAYFLYVYLAGRWDWIGYYARYIAMVALIVVAAFSWRSASRLPLFPEANLAAWGPRLTFGCVFVVFALFALLAYRGLSYPTPPVRLAFPLRDGTFYVAQGGASKLINHHNGHPAQRYALDIVGLNGWGFRARGLLPQDLEAYVIYGQKVVSPCGGTVVKAVDQLPDQTPPAADPKNPAGNHIVLRCQGVSIVLAHLMPGSQRVAAGDSVREGQELAQVGNSGNTTEPHLHVHAVRGSADSVFEGEGAPILFDGRFLTRNSIVRP